MDTQAAAQMLQALFEAVREPAQNSEHSKGGEDGKEVKALLAAAAAGDLRKFRKIIADGVDPGAASSKGATALHLAAAKGESAIVKELLDFGVDIDVVDKDGDTPLVFAVLSEMEDMVQLLIDRGANLKIVNHRAMTAADVALRRQNLLIVFQLEGACHCLQFDCDLHGESLGLAAQEGNLDVIEFWLENHRNRQVVNYRISDDRTLAFTVALNGHLQILELLDRYGADFDIADNRCNTPLFCASQNGHLECAHLLAGKSNVNHRSLTQRTPIFSAIINNHAEVVKLLLEAGADATAADEDGCTPLEFAIREDNAEIFNLLVRAGVDLRHINSNGLDYVAVATHADKLQMLLLLRDLKDKGVSLRRVNPSSGSTALLTACQFGNEKAVQVLIDAGSDVNHRNKHGVSPALRAAFNEHLGVLKILDKAGANLDLETKNKETAVLCAAQKNSLEIIRFLDSRGCDLAVTDRNKKTMAWHAAKNSNPELIELLRDAEAPLDVADSDGDTPLIIAVSQSCAASVQLLAAAGSNKAATNAKGETPVTLAEKGRNAAVLAALGLAVPDSSHERPPVAAAARQLNHQPLKRNDGPHIQLDAGFKTWDFFYDDAKKRPIGEGGFGQVFKAYTDKHQFVAVKVVRGGAADSQRFASAVECERRGMEILRQVQHPNIMTFLRCELKDDNFYIFTELITGVSLADLMQRQKKGFKPDAIRKFSDQICAGLNHLHTRNPIILHRDIKCSNIMLNNEGCIKLIDFGLAKEVMCASEVYTSVTQCGTVCYMAPELLNGDGHAAYSSKSDVWAFGCSLYEMAARIPPNANLIRQEKVLMAIRENRMPGLPQEFPEDLKQFYANCISFDAFDRPDTNELLQHSFLTG